MHRVGSWVSSAHGRNPSPVSLTHLLFIHDLSASGSPCSDAVDPLPIALQIPLSLRNSRVGELLAILSFSGIGLLFPRLVKLSLWLGFYHDKYVMASLSLARPEQHSHSISEVHAFVRVIITVIYPLQFIYSQA